MEESKCNKCCDCDKTEEYFGVTWTQIWDDGAVDEGSISTNRDVGTFEDFLEWVIRPLCRSVGFHSETVDKYIKEIW